MRRFSLALFIAASLLACSKAPAPVVVPEPGGSWTLDTQTTVAAFSDVTARQGYLLTFSDRSTTSQLSFLFRRRPDASTTFNAAADTAREADVGLSAIVGGTAFHATGLSNNTVRVELEGGRLHLIGAGLSVQADTGRATATTLVFDLRQY